MRALSRFPTILRRGAFMEDRAEMIGRPVVRQGWTLVFGTLEGFVRERHARRRAAAGAGVTPICCSRP